MMWKQMTRGLALLLGSAGVAQADYMTGFETSNDAGYVVGQPLDGIDGWVQLQGTNDGATVVGAPSPVNSGTQAARFVMTSNPSRAARAFDALSGNTVVLDFSLAFERTGNATTSYSYVFFGDSSDLLPGGGVPEAAAVMVGFRRVNNTDQVVYRDGGSYVALGAAEANAYYRFVAHVDLAANTYDLTVTGSNINTTVEDITFRDSNDVDEISGMMVIPYSGEASLYMDDVSVGLIPEPGSMTLVGTGALLLLSRGRRR